MTRCQYANAMIASTIRTIMRDSENKITAALRLIRRSVNKDQADAMTVLGPCFPPSLFAIDRGYATSINHNAIGRSPLLSLFLSPLRRLLCSFHPTPAILHDASFLRSPILPGAPREPYTGRSSLHSLQHARHPCGTSLRPDFGHPPVSCVGFSPS